MAQKLVDEKFDNFVSFLKDKASKISEYKQYENKELLTKMVLQYVKPAYLLGQLENVNKAMCELLGVCDCCDKKKVARYLEFFCEAL